MTNNFEKDINVPSKEIIIDGVDVSECECYSVHREGYCGWHTPCEGDSCQYKLEWALEQLKRKEQECEELKKTVDNLLHKPEIQDKILWKVDNEALLGSKDAYIYKLEKTLAEIKEIVKEQLPTVNYNFAKSMHPEMFNCYEQILQKINECEVKE